MSETKSFWTTLPGILTGIAGVITAIGGLLVILHQIEVIGPNTSPDVMGSKKIGPEWIGRTELEPNQNIKIIKELKNQIAEIDIKIKISEEELARSPHQRGSLHELQDIRREREKRIEEVENLQRELRTEVEQLRLNATGDPDARRRIEQIEGETIPDLKAERTAVQTQLQELYDMIRKAEKRDELRGRINELNEKKQSLQEDINRLTRQIPPTANSGD